MEVKDSHDNMNNSSSMTEMSCLDVSVANNICVEAFLVGRTT